MGHTPIILATTQKKSACGHLSSAVPCSNFLPLSIPLLCCMDGQFHNYHSPLHPPAFQ